MKLSCLTSRSLSYVSLCSIDMEDMYAHFGSIASSTNLNISDLPQAVYAEVILKLGHHTETFISVTHSQNSDDLEYKISVAFHLDVCLAFTTPHITDFHSDYYGHPCFKCCNHSTIKNMLTHTLTILLANVKLHTEALCVTIYTLYQINYTHLYGPV